ncbi:hypothetical protein AB205_0138260, partial [Aquarana catesbeiana]
GLQAGWTSRDDISLCLLHISALHSRAFSIWERGVASSREMTSSLTARHTSAVFHPHSMVEWRSRASCHRGAPLCSQTPLLQCRRCSGEQRDDIISHCPPCITALLLSLNGPVLSACHQCSVSAHLVALAGMASYNPHQGCGNLQIEPGDMASDNLQMVAGDVASDNLQMVARDVASDNLQMVAGDVASDNLQMVVGDV